MSDGGNELDVNAMLNFQDNPKGLIFENKGLLTKEDESKTPNNQSTNQIVLDKLSIKAMIVDKMSINNKNVDKLSINDIVVDKLSNIVMYLANNPHSKTENVADLLGMSVSSAKQYLRQLTDMKIVSPDGANRNRTYSLLENAMKFRI